MIFDDEPFIFVEATETLPGAGFILSTSPPFYIGRVIKMEAQDYERLNREEKASYVNCEGYSVCILPAGSLTGEQSEDIRIVLAKMANYYLKFKIEKYWQRFKRYRI
jgi:hypothetical protein